MLKVMSLFIGTLVLFSACAGSNAAVQGSADSTREAQDAAMAALAALDGGSRNSDASALEALRPPAPAAASQTPAAQAQSPAAPAQTPPPQGGPQAGGPRAKPAWVDSPEAVYSRDRYIAVVGYGPDRNRAERDGLAKLTGLFGQSIQADLKTVAVYSEAVKNGAVQVSETSSVENAIIASAEMDTLVGAEIADVWTDAGQNICYAAAVMEKEKTATLYADLIRSNERIVAGLVDMPLQTKNSLDGYSRLILAGTIADANRVYANVLTVVGDSRGIDPAAMKKGDDYRLEAAAAARNIPIGVAVSGDRGNRIKSAFAKALSDSGFRSGGTNSRYTVNASVSIDEAVYPGQPNKFVRYHVTGGLEDSAEGNSVLVPFDASGREGHLTVAQAEERAFAAAEKKIAGEFGPALKEYLASLLPSR